MPRKKKNKKTEEEPTTDEPKTVNRQVQIATLTASVSISSSCDGDDFNKLKKIAVDIMENFNR